MSCLFDDEGDCPSIIELAHFAENKINFEQIICRNDKLIAEELPTPAASEVVTGSRRQYGMLSGRGLYAVKAAGGGDGGGVDD